MARACHKLLLELSEKPVKPRQPAEPGVQKTASARRLLFRAPFLSISLAEILRFQLLAERLIVSCSQGTFVEEICSANPSNPPGFLSLFPTYVILFHISNI